MGMSPYMRSLRAVWGSGRLLMPSVSGIVRDSDGRILLVHQRDDGVWSTPGGAIELDETPADAVVREVREETGLSVVPRRVFGVFGGPAFVVRYPNGDETQYVSCMFECEIVSGALQADGDETQGVEFWSESDAKELPLAPWLKGILPRLFEQRSDAWFEVPSQIGRGIG